MENHRPLGPPTQVSGTNANTATTNVLNTQGSSNATQEISQAGVEQFMRSRSEQSLRLEHEPEQLPYKNAQEDDEVVDGLQNTIVEGDSNFLDIASSFAVGHMDAESLPLTLSPPQSQQPLTQFPESQRFRTPGTVGKKRDHNGNVLHTPALSRNPFAKTAQSLGDVGLSQAFANTQAPSSPPANVPTPGLRSDRPSPGIEMDRCVQKHPSSSPMQFLSEKRPLAEPASRYIPVHQSQLHRQSSPERDRDAENQESPKSPEEDDWRREDSMLARQRRMRARETRARDQLKSASSPLSSDKNDSSGEQGHAQLARPTTRSVRSKPLSSSPPHSLRKDKITVAIATSEAQQGGVDYADSTNDNSDYIETAHLLSNPLSSREIHHATVIPDTTKRIETALSQSFPLIQSSPSAHRTRQRKLVPIASSSNPGPVRVVNSQRSAPSTQINSMKFTVTSSADSVEMVPASPEGQLVPTQPSRSMQQQDLRRQEVDSIEGKLAIGKGLIDDLLEDVVHDQGDPNSTIPETSSSAVAQEENRQSEYTTAPTNQPAGSSKDTEWSSQPVRTTPPGKQRKRKRMEEMSQDEVVQTVTQSSSFDPAEVLALDQDPDAADALKLSQDAGLPRLQKRTRGGRLTTRMQTEKHETNLSNGSIIDRADLNVNNTRMESIERSRLEFDTENHVSRNGDDITLSDSAQTPSSRNRRKSTWDLGLSPQPRYILKALGQRRHLNTSTVQQQAKQQRQIKSSGKTISALAELPSIEETSPNTLDNVVAWIDPSNHVESSDKVTSPNMVFAYFMDKTKKYYPAICLEALMDSKKYTIKWPGYEPENVPSHGICSLDLRVGDEVKVELDKFPRTSHVVLGFKSNETSSTLGDKISDIYGHTHVILEPKNSKVARSKKSIKPDVVSIRHIYLDSNMWNRICGRPFLYQSNLIGSFSGIATPPLRSSTPATPSSRGRSAGTGLQVQIPRNDGLFSNMVFALSFEDVEVRERTSDLVKDNGGLILEQSFRDLVEDDLSVKVRFSRIGFTALLADKHSTKEKYMQALALGLPCLSGRWVEASIKSSSLVDWREYLLPAGESVELDGATRSRIMPYESVTQSKLVNVIGLRPQFFNQCSVIFVTGRGKAGKKHAPYLFFVQIMGANQVSTVTDLVAAKEKLCEGNNQEVIWVVVEDKDYSAARAFLRDMERKFTEKSRDQKYNAQKASKIHIADNELVKQSLIMGRLVSRDD